MARQPAARQRSILEDLGEEITAIITPVSICMALTVMLVKTLNPTGASDVHSVFIASAFYTEQVRSRRYQTACGSDNLKTAQPFGLAESGLTVPSSHR